MSVDTTVEAAADRRGRLPSRPGEEDLRFIRNFHDVFLSIGIALFAVGLGVVSALTLAERVNVESFADLRRTGWLVAAVAGLNAVVMWLMAEFFARSRRLFLPAIIILLAFLTFVLVAVIAGYVTLLGDRDYDTFDDALTHLRALPLAVTLAATLAIFAFYLRMKLPFAMGLGSAALASAGIAAWYYMEPDGLAAMSETLTLAAGLFLFSLGVFFDARDPERRTRLSDNGFWLHFFAAPLVFNSILTLVSGSLWREGSFDGPVTAITTLAVVLVFAIISLLINRRALLVAGLLSAAVAVTVLVGRTGLSEAWTGAVTLLVLGGAMVLLGGGWHWVRRRLVAPFPKTGLLARIVPPEPEPGDWRGREAAEEGASR